MRFDVRFGDRGSPSSATASLARVEAWVVEVAWGSIKNGRKDSAALRGRVAAAGTEGDLRAHI